MHGASLADGADRFVVAARAPHLLPAFQITDGRSYKGLVFWQS